MLRFIVIAVLLAGTVGAQAAEWFTIVGDPSDANSDTIQLDPVVRRTQGTLKTMGIRVSRSIQRTSGNGTLFRSYEGAVEFDCERQTARFVSSQFFKDPLWRSPGPLVEYLPSDIRPMAFRLFEPNPRERVIRAACQPYSR